MKQEYPENAVITVKIPEIGLETDVRLASDAPFHNWLPELVQLLNNHFGTNLDPKKVRAVCKGTELQANDTPAKLGIWDGSVLKLEEV